MRPNSHRHLPERRGGALRPPRTVPTAMWRGVAAPPRTLGLAPCLGLYTLPAAEAQVTASGAEDKAVLLELKAAADASECIGIGLSTLEDPCPFDSWAAATEPCGDGWDDITIGWLGVVCNESGGRVVDLELWDTHIGGELLPFFGRLGALLALALYDNPTLRGDVADLAGATELRKLALHDCPLVDGDLAVLAALVHLGGEYQCTAGGCTGFLSLQSTAVHGSVAPLRALPGLGADWAGFTPCWYAEESRACPPPDWWLWLQWSILLLCVALGVFAMKKRQSLAAKCSKQERDSTEEQAAKSVENPSAQ